MGFRRSSEFRQWLAAPFGGSLDTLARTDPRLPILVVGAGPAGLAAMAALKRAGIRFEGVDSHRQIGGIWDATNPVSSVYEGMRTVTSRFTTHLGPPMPASLPHFVPHGEAHHYLLDFAKREGILPHIQLNTRLEDASKTDRGTWMAQLSRSDDGESFSSEYRAIVIATGSHNKNHRSVPQRLWEEAVDSGVTALHSADYSDAAPFAGKRVVVIGVGNSGTDVADKISTVAQQTLLSVRTPPWINPATILGTPCDKMAADSTWLPHWYQMTSFHVIRRLAIGPLRKLGLSTPQHRLLDRVPVTDRGIVRAIREGRVTVRPHVISLKDGLAHYDNARQPDEPVDAVVFATGFVRQYPLLPALDADGDAVNDLLTYFIFHRQEPGLAFMTEVVGTWSCWPIFVEQARAIAAYYAAEEREGGRIEEFNARRNLPSPSFKGPLFAGANGYHIDYGIYMRALRDLTAWLSAS